MSDLADDIAEPTVTVDADQGTAARSADRRTSARRSRGVSLLRETVVVLVGALVLSLVVKTFFLQAFFIPSASMEDTLIEHDKIVVNKLAPGPFSVHRGDIVVFKDPGGWLLGQPQPDPGPVRSAINQGLSWVGLYPQDAGEHLVKRVIGMPGDHVKSTGDGGPVTVNGIALDEPYLKPGSIPSEVAFDVVVPPDSIWVMGDNRQASRDSRYNQGRPGGGSVPIGNVVGVAFVTVWPLERAGLLSNPDETFTDVPNP
ncbi:signal peptidase I [Cellulomonas sp. URHB0016]